MKKIIIFLLVLFSFGAKAQIVSIVDSSGYLIFINPLSLDRIKLAPSYIGTGSNIGTKYLRGDGTWQTLVGGGDALTSNPLSQFASTTSAQFAGVISDETGSGKVVLQTDATHEGTTTFNGPIIIAAVTATTPAINLVAGTLRTTPSAGDIEYDGNTIYATTDAGNRGYVPVYSLIRADATRTFTSNTSAQAIFTTPANGTLTLETGTYLFDGILNFTGMSATSGNLKFDVLGTGTATAAAVLFHVVGVDGATGAAATQTGSTAVGVATPNSAVTAGTGTAATLNITGTFEVTAAGTIIPSITMVTASASVLSIGSYLKFTRIGSTTVTSIGQWN